MSGRVIAGDIGGTKTLLRCVEPSGAIAAEQRFKSSSYASFDNVFREFMAMCPAPVDAACLAVAGPVISGRAEVTNLEWVMEYELLQRTFGIRTVELINDFYAVALGVPLLADEDLVTLQNAPRDRSAPMGILGAGTGLGEAFVVRAGDRWVVVPSEGGHTDFAPQDEEQSRLFLWLHKEYGHVSWERLVSGMGLVNIFTFLGGRTTDAAAVAAQAAQGDARARRAFQIFVDIYGAEAGNMALRCLARGGVFLAGGIAAKNIPWFTDGRFMDAFLRKGRFRELMLQMPVNIIINEHVGLIGAADLAKRLVST